MIGCEGLARDANAARATGFQLRFNSYYRELKKEMCVLAALRTSCRSFARSRGRWVEGEIDVDAVRRLLLKLGEGFLQRRGAHTEANGVDDEPNDVELEQGDPGRLHAEASGG